jgi:CubicO group peptidase (beta-lactamase class C family)
MARALKWGLLVVLLAVIAAVAVAPQFWKRWPVAAIYGSTDAPLWFYRPRELIAGAPASGMPHESAEDQQIEPSALQAAAEYAEQHRSRALIVSRRSHLVLEKYWDGVEGRTLDNSGNLSRVLTTVMLGVAIGESKIGSVDEPAANYIKEWRADDRKRIRIRDLAQMSSGLKASRFGDSEGRLQSDILARHLAQPVDATPGERWLRQNIDPQMLALVIERATAQPYARYVSENLWKRIGAGDAYFWQDRAGGTAHADCCMLARPGDWMRVAEVLANDGVYLGEEILRPGWIKQMLTPAKANANYGFQVWLHDVSAAEPIAVDDMFFVDDGRYRLWISPRLRLAILRIGGGRDGKDWSDTRIPNLIIRGLRDYAPPAVAPSQKIDPNLYAPGH